MRSPVVAWTSMKTPEFSENVEANIHNLNKCCKHCKNRKLIDSALESNIASCLIISKFKLING